MLYFWNIHYYTNWLRRDLLRIHQRIQAEELASSVFQLHPERTGSCNWLANWIRQSSTCCFNWETGQRPGDLPKRRVASANYRQPHHKVIGRHCDYVQMNSVSKIDQISRVVFPLLFLVINLFYWFYLFYWCTYIPNDPWRGRRFSSLLLYFLVKISKEKETKAERNKTEKDTLQQYKNKVTRGAVDVTKKRKLKLNEFKFYFRLRLDRSCITTCWSHPHEYSRSEQSVRWAGDQAASRTKSVWRSSVYLRRQKMNAIYKRNSVDGAISRLAVERSSGSSWTQKLKRL